MLLVNLVDRMITIWFEIRGIFEIAPVKKTFQSRTFLFTIQLATENMSEYVSLTDK